MAATSPIGDIQLNRRKFLRVSSLGGGALVFGGAAVLSACDPVGLAPADSAGIRVHPFFTARVLATTGQPVAGTGYTLTFSASPALAPAVSAAFNVAVPGTPDHLAMRTQPAGAVEGRRHHAGPSVRSR